MMADLDDTFGNAIQLGTASTQGKTVSDQISIDTDVDMYALHVTAGQVIDFDIDTALNGPGGLGSYIRLFNAQGTQLDFNNDGIAPGENAIGFDAYLRRTFPSSGTFYLGVSNFNNSTYNPVNGSGDIAGGSNATGSYQLTVRVLPADLDDTMLEAVSLGAVSITPTTTSSGIDPDIDVDMYKFTVTAGQIVDFDVDTALNGPGGLGSYMRLFNSQGVQLDFNDDAAGPDETLGFDAYLRYTFANAGTYYVGISNFSNILYSPSAGTGDTAGGQYSIGEYQLIVQAIVVPTSDTDDAMSESISLGAASTTATTVSNTISVDIDVDMFAFTVTAGQIVDFDIDTILNGPGGLGSYIRLFNAQGMQINFNNDGAAPGENFLGYDAYLRHTFASAGTFYLGVSNVNNVNYNAASGNGDTAGGNNTTGSYQLSMRAIPVDVDDSMNEATSLGAVSTTPSNTNATIDPDVDVDMYKFTVTAGQMVDFDIDTTQNGAGGLGSYLRLFNSQGTQIDFNDDAAATDEVLGFDAYLRHTFSAAGTYYLGVSNLNNILYSPSTGASDAAGGPYSIGDYQLRVQAIVLPTTDTDDAISEAIPLGSISSTPKTSSNNLAVDTDVDMYSFSVTAGQIVDFDMDTTLNGPGGLGSYIRLFNAQGTQLAFNNDGAAPGENTVGYDSYLRYTFAFAGTFYLGVSNFNNANYNPLSGNGDTIGGSSAVGSYQLTVRALPIDLDDTLPEALSLGAISTTPVVTNSTIDPDVDVDMYKFSVAADQTIDFDIDTVLNGSGGLGSFIRLFNAQGVQLDFNDDAAAPDETPGFDAFLRYTFATAGTYYLGVSNFNNTHFDAVSGGNDVAGGTDSIGDYRLTIATVVPITPELKLAINPGTIPEIGGVATATITRSNADTSLSIGVSVASSDSTQATAPSVVYIPANQASVSFQIVALHNTAQGTKSITFTATASSFTADSQKLLVTDGDATWHNFQEPKDVDDDGNISPLDVLQLVNYLNSFGAGYVPEGNPPPYLDVDADNQITPLDVLIVINHLNNTGNAEGQGEGEAAVLAEDSSAPGSTEDAAHDVFFSQVGQWSFSDIDASDSATARKGSTRR